MKTIYALPLIALLALAPAAQAKVPTRQAKSEKALVAAASKAQQIYQSQFNQEKANQAASEVLSTCSATLASLESNVSADAGAIFSYSVVGGANRDAAAAANNYIAAQYRAGKFIYLTGVLWSAYSMNQDNALNVSAAYLSPTDFCDNLTTWSKTERDHGQLLVENMPQVFKEQLAIARAVTNSYNGDILKKYASVSKAARKYRVKDLDVAAFLYGYGSAGCNTADCYQVDNYFSGFAASVLPIDEQKISRTSAGLNVPIVFTTILSEPVKFAVALKQNNPRTGRPLKAFCKTEKVTSGVGVYSADCLIPNSLLKINKTILLEPSIVWETEGGGGFAAGESLAINLARAGR